MADVVELTVVKPKGKRPPGREGRKIDYERAYRLRQDGLSYDAIAASFGVKSESLQSAMSRKGLLKPDIRPLRTMTQVKVVMAQPVTGVGKIGEEVRANLAHALKSQSEALKAAEHTQDTLTGRDGLATALKTVSDAASTVFGWSDSGAPGVLLSGMVPEPIDVVAEVKPISVPPPTVPAS